MYQEFTGFINIYLFYSSFRIFRDDLLNGVIKIVFTCENRILHLNPPNHYLLFDLGREEVRVSFLGKLTKSVLFVIYIEFKKHTYILKVLKL